MSKDFDLLASLAAFAHERGIGFNDPTLIANFTAEATPRLEAALADQALIQGSRTEKLFEAMVLSLGQFKLFKTEDTGRVHAAEKLRAPDFRVVLNDGEQWLIEVKNVRRQDPSKQRTTFTANYLSTLRGYADAVGVPLRIAIYWSTWKLWSLIDPADFATSTGSLRVEMLDAMTASHMWRLGDVSINTTSPLRFTVLKRPDGKVDTPQAGAMGLLAVSRMFSGDVELTEPRERHLARTLFAFGEWPLQGPTDVTDENGNPAYEFVAEPEEPSDQGFDGVGWASRIFSRYFAEQTQDGDRVIQLHGMAAPDWFAPLSAWHATPSALPLWLIHLKPAPRET